MVFWKKNPEKTPIRVTTLRFIIRHAIVQPYEKKRMDVCRFGLTLWTIT